MKKISKILIGSIIVMSIFVSVLVIGFGEVFAREPTFYFLSCKISVYTVNEAEPLSWAEAGEKKVFTSPVGTGTSFYTGDKRKDYKVTLITENCIGRKVKLDLYDAGNRIFINGFQGKEFLITEDTTIFTFSMGNNSSDIDSLCSEDDSSVKDICSVFPKITVGQKPNNKQKFGEKIDERKIHTYSRMKDITQEGLIIVHPWVFKDIKGAKVISSCRIKPDGVSWKTDAVDEDGVSTPSIGYVLDGGEQSEITATIETEGCEDGGYIYVQIKNGRDTNALVSSFSGNNDAVFKVEDGTKDITLNFDAGSLVSYDNNRFVCASKRLIPIISAMLLNLDRLVIGVRRLKGVERNCPFNLYVSAPYVSYDPPNFGVPEKSNEIIIGTYYDEDIFPDGILGSDEDSTKLSWKYTGSSNAIMQAFERPAALNLQTQLAVTNPNSPCLNTPNDPTSGYKKNCYDFLTPIPGIGEKYTYTKTIIDSDGNEKEIIVDGAFIEETGKYHFGNYVNTIFKILLGLAMVIAVVMIVIGGLQYMTTDAILGKEEAKGTITKAITGLILALGTVVILQTIDPDLLNISLGSFKGVSFDADQNISGESVSDVGSSYSIGQDNISNGIKSIKDDLDNGVKIKSITITGTEGSRKGTAIIELVNGKKSGSFNVGFGTKGISKNWIRGQGQTPTGTFTLGKKRYDYSKDGESSILTRSNPKSNLGPAFISVDQAPYVGIGIHGKKEANSTGSTLGCIRVRNEDLVIFMKNFSKGKTKIILIST